MTFLFQLVSAYGTQGPLSRRAFCRVAPLALVIGFALATGATWALYGTPFLWSNPAVLRGDPLPYFLFGGVTIALVTPLIIKRMRDVGRSPLIFALVGGVAFGFMVFSAPMPARLPIATLEDFVARHVVFSPFALVGLWVLYECCFCGSALAETQKQRVPSAANYNEARTN